jgi:peroxiredoxin
MKTRIIVGLAALALGMAASFIVLQHDGAPEVRFATLAGESFSTSDLRGKVVMVNFWATSCVPCVKEMPKLIETYKKYAPRGGYEMIAVAMSHDHPNQVAEFTRQRALPFKVALDPGGAIAKGFGDVRITPTTFVLDRQGRVLKRYLGEPDWAEFHDLLDKALRDPA